MSLLPGYKTYQEVVYELLKEIAADLNTIKNDLKSLKEKDNEKTD